MIVESRISFSRLARLIWKELLCILAVAALPVIALIYFDLGEYTINASIPLVIGTAIAIFLGFRTNSAYERWWEARKLWGAVLCDSRSLLRQWQSALHANDQLAETQRREAVRLLCDRQIAWAWGLDHWLKELPPPHHLPELLGESFSSEVQPLQHDPLIRILTLHSEAVSEALRNGWIQIQQAVMLEETLNRLTDHYGGCQRLKSTVFPTHYTFFTRVFIWIFLILLACSLPSHENANYALIPAIFLIGWVFFMVEGIGNYMQNPFVNNRNVIPMDALSRTLERDLLQMIGQKQLPPPVEPIDGALY